MNRVLKVTIAVAVVSVASVTTVAAQSVRFGLGGGLILPMSDYKNLDKTGWHGLALVEFAVPMSPVSVRADVMYGQTSHKDTVGGAVAGNTKLIGGTADLVWHISGLVPGFKPYLLGGVGMYNVKAEYPPAASTSATKFTWGLGVGASVGVGPVHGFVEGRYMSVQGSAAALKFIPVTVGLQFGM
jgi:opacity protein-like surface antigen